MEAGAVPGKMASSNLPDDQLNVIGINGWAWRRNHRYGTIVCNLERRRIVTLLPDREIATVKAWLTDYLEIEIVSRDRRSGYGEAVAKALPQAIQVADRWHFMENAGTVMNSVREAIIMEGEDHHMAIERELLDRCFPAAIRMRCFPGRSARRS